MRYRLYLTVAEGGRSCPSLDHLQSKMGSIQQTISMGGRARDAGRTMRLKVGATLPRLELILAAPLAAFLSNALGGGLCPAPNMAPIGCCEFFPFPFPLAFRTSHSGLWNAGGWSAEKLVLAALADLTAMGESGPLRAPISFGCSCASRAETSTQPVGHFTPWDTLNSGREG